ncbi:hypothetical protein FOQG_01137 [Fusarium oxysporum f. sp. raphani 54005]|uniref:Uncharacterized protein n=2 Tax=Fusarium oxysporum TaxID=5507 RepID=X0CUJ9_FUSOX|nr:hypothetical protein FOVG_08978 [Fusarium oxysporum f. sp. pisi HDV247]EXA40005.1 hypothetical protein FOVG_08978 [Fusarium oxysporum f. sp. pisi HDV247]EXK98129.1 hypothetical protein FOQG_01137 [Fusarium oxysporum f. sp. raphani 54005]EXK98130.1 hypothetical protein FOQG_01137 [Fusarium oxysporum f. sp. raphani 54005]
MIMAARFTPEAFLPSGAYDSDVFLSLNSHLPYRNTSSIPSPPNSHPRTGTLRHQYPQHYLNPCQPQNQDYSQSQFQRGRIPPASTLPLQHKDSSPLSLESLRAAQSVPPSYRPFPQQTESFDTFDARPATVSPTHGGPPPVPEFRFPASSTAPLPNVSSSSGLVGASLSRSVSADAVAASQSSVHVVQRLVQQNQLIREAWEAERNHLEANRRRAEEVYQEERIIMDEVRDSWEAEKEGMAREIEELKERVHRLEGENSALKAVTAQSIQVTGVVSPLASQRGGSGEGSMDSSYFQAPPGRLASRGQNSTIPTGLSMSDASSLPPGLDGASRRPHYFQSSSARVSPTTQPESSPFVPLDPRMQTQNPVAKDFLSSPTEDVATPVPVIDVQEIDPKLEGIPLKATAVQKPTFAAGASPPENPASPVASPPGPVARSPEQSRRPTNARASSKEYTLQALSAVESRRLTMHAGHTPNHSLSLFPKVNPTDPGSIIGEAATPTVESVINLDAAVVAEEEKNDSLSVPVQSDRRDSKVSFISVTEELDPNAPDLMMEPSGGDKALKGPLMLRNMPAKDELFFEKLHEALEPISQGQNALPAVMQGHGLGSIAGPSGSNAPTHMSKQAGPVGGDGSADAQRDADDSDGEGSGKAIEIDVPLKLKSTSNFGAPFGAM